MRRVLLLTLLISSLPMLMQAQRGAGMSSVHGGVGAVHSNFAPQNHPRGLHSNGAARRTDNGHVRHPKDSFRQGVFPYFLPDYETDWPEAVDTEERRTETPLVRVHSESRDLEAERPLPAQVIEIPNVSRPTDMQPLPATVFVLTNGEKLETERYLLTASSLSLTLHHDQRTIPLRMLDLDATIAANRDRGIDLRIPNDRNEIWLRF